MGTAPVKTVPNSKLAEQSFVAIKLVRPSDGSFNQTNVRPIDFQPAYVE
jgi:hypothetical protein